MALLTPNNKSYLHVTAGVGHYQGGSGAQECYVNAL